MHYACFSQLKKWISVYQREHSRTAGKKTTRAVSAAFPGPSSPLQPQRRSSNSPSPSPSSSSHLPHRAASSSTTQKAPGHLKPQPHTAGQTLPMRAVSGPTTNSSSTAHSSGQKKSLLPQPHVIGQSIPRGVTRGRVRPLNPVFGQKTSDGPVMNQRKQGSGVMWSHAIPQPVQVSFQGHHHPLVTPHPTPQPHHSLPPPPPPHPLAALWQFPPAHKHHPYPHPHSSPSAQQYNYVPHPTSAFNPVTTASATQRSTKGAPASNFNPFTALGVSTTTVQSGSPKVDSQSVSSPYQWNGNGFTPVVVKLRPAKSWTRFKFDKPHILSAMWSDIGCF